MRKNHFLLFLAVIAVCLLTSCSATKNVPYMINYEALATEAKAQLYDARVMPKDVLSIIVNTVNPAAAQQFNLTASGVMTQANSSLSSQPMLQTYLVDNDGNINFPIVGKIHVAGLTKSETEQLITEKIRPYLSETEHPIVTVRMSSYSISVLGEVNAPGNFIVSREKVNIFEALALAGDMTIYGVRNNVKLIREDATGKKEIHTLNLNDANVINSPYYYLQQNDILYVEPNKIKAQNSAIGSMTTLWISVSSVLVSIATLLVSVLR